MCVNKKIECNSTSENKLLTPYVLSDIIEEILSKVFFIQERIGKGGEKFRMYKVQTMVNGSDVNLPEDVVKGEKINRDPRIIPGRGWVRRCGIDELPQILNILKGDMNLFGPRPPIPEEFDSISSETRKARIVKYKPGIFGNYAFHDKGKKYSTRTQKDNFDVYLRLRYIREKEGILSMMRFNLYIFLNDIRALTKGINK